FAAVQKHIAILERAGVVTKERIGRRKVVRTNLERLRAVRRMLDQYEELWRGRIHGIAEVIDFMAPDAFPEIAAATGAMLIGRRTYEEGKRQRDADELGGKEYDGGCSGPVFRPHP